MNEAVLILDCGASSVRAVAVDFQGKVLAKEALPNATRPSPENPHWHLWPLEEILSKLGTCSRALKARLPQLTVKGLAITSFGVDGAFLDEQGRLLYPVISWKCPRTQALMQDFEEGFGGFEALQALSGLGRFSFNTVYKMAWFQKERPDILEKAKTWLFMPSLLARHLGASYFTDRTMAGTSALYSVKQDQFCPEILKKLSLDASVFPPLKEIGEAVGTLNAQGASLLGLKEGLPLFSAGHDTQCALLGSGAGQGQAVLSSGTWEILMCRTDKVHIPALTAYPASTCELDAETGLLNPGLQWLASGAIEWVRKTWYSPETPYEKLIAEAASWEPGAGGLRFSKDFFLKQKGALEGLSPTCEAGQVFRACLEGLALVLKDQLSALETLAGLEPKELIMVGGGTQNALWNQLKATALQRTLLVLEEPETTVLGAACGVLKGLGLYSSLEEARKAFSPRYKVWEARS